MKKIILGALAVCGMLQPAYAEVEETFYEESETQAELSYVRPGPRPGRPGPYPSPPRRPEPRPRPPAPHPGYPPRNPGYPPPPPPNHGRLEYYRCDSYGPNNYYQCYIGYGARNVRLIQQHSWESCVYGRSYGIMSDRIWVNHGCKATFEIVRY